MELILSSYDIAQKIVKAIMSMYSYNSATMLTPDGQSDLFDITAGVLQGDTLSPFIFVVVVDYMPCLLVCLIEGITYTVLGLYRLVFEAR